LQQEGREDIMKPMGEIQFILDRIHATWGLECTGLSRQLEIVVRRSGEAPVTTYLEEKKQQVEMVYEECLHHEAPMMFRDGATVNYFGFTDEEGLLYLAGPFSYEPLSFKEQYGFRQRHPIYDKDFQVPVLEFEKLLNCMVVSYYMLTGRQITETELLLQNDESKRIYRKDEIAYEIYRQTEEEVRLAYEEEQRWLAQIESGVVDTNRLVLNEENLQKLKNIGTLAEKNTNKQVEYMVITAVALVCRAAIRGGVNTHDAYNLSDLYYQQVAKCNNEVEMLNVYINMMVGFAEHVRETKEKRLSADVEKCKDFIARNRTRDFTLADMAREIGKNPSYLSNKFSKEVGMTLKDYTRQQRLEAAANMLTYSDMSIGDIAEYLHFSSQSYFGVCFRNLYHETPAKYRENHRIIDFSEK
jgi:AraC-like DNA-binding protein